jgi:hypothetical protein
MIILKVPIFTFINNAFIKFGRVWKSLVSIFRLLDSKHKLPYFVLRVENLLNSTMCKSNENCSKTLYGPSTIDI